MIRKKRSDEKGAAAVEFALVASVALIPLLMGTIDVSMMFNQRTQLQNAAMQGARHFAINHDAPAAKAVVINAVPSNLALTTADVQILAMDGVSAGSCPGASQANQVIVTKTNYQTITGFLGPLFTKIDGRGVAECM